MRLRSILFFSSLILFGAATATAQSIQSLYTDLGGKACKEIKIESDPAESSKQECRGVAGYKLLVLEGDLRQSITVVRPDGSEHELNLWSSVGGGGFSHLGPKAEWRVKRQQGKLTPLALIVRYEVSENAADSSKTTSYLAVVKITPERICLTDTLRPRANANIEARRLADNSAGKPCLSSP
jgi:hypothetical protein